MTSFSSIIVFWSTHAGICLGGRTQICKVSHHNKDSIIKFTNAYFTEEFTFAFKNNLIFQLKELRQVKSDEGVPFTYNYRPVQPLNGRKILYKPSSKDDALLCGVSQASSTFADLLLVVLIPLAYTFYS